MELPTIFRLQFGKNTYGLGTHSTSLPHSREALGLGPAAATLAPGATSSGGEGWEAEGSPSHRQREGGPAGLVSFQGERRRLHPGCTRRLFISMAGWRHARAPGTPTSIARFQAQHQPGTFLN